MMRAYVKCRICDQVLTLAGGEQQRCRCGNIIILEETAAGGFVARMEYDPPQSGIKPIPQIVG